MIHKTEKRRKYETTNFKTYNKSKNWQAEKSNINNKLNE